MQFNPDAGNKLTELPRKVRFVRDLEAFEGPILSEYHAASGTGLYVEKWCERDGAISRYLLVRSDQRALAEFLGGKLSMLRLLREASDGIGFLIDRMGSELVAIHISALANLPRAYFPTASRYHDPDLRPAWAVVPQSYLYDETWDSNMFATIERNYFNAAGFAYLTKPNTNRSLPPSILDFVYEGGYSVMHAFNYIRAAVPVSDRAKSGSIVASSPGVLTIDAPAETADRLGQALRALSRSLVHYRNIHEWSRLSPERVAETPLLMPPLEVADEQIERLCSALDVDSTKLYPSTVASEFALAATMVAGKLIAAYYRVLLRVLDPMPNAEFLGVEIAHADQIERPSIGPTDTFEDEPETIQLRR
jgi:hypothetical protein